MLILLQKEFVFKKAVISKRIIKMVKDQKTIVPWQTIPID